MKVYFATPMSGRSLRALNNDFGKLRTSLRQAGVQDEIKWLLPWRDLEIDPDEIIASVHVDSIVGQANAITYRDHDDIRKADLMVVWVKDLPVSLGVCIEIGVASEARTQFIVYRNEGSPYDYPMINVCGSAFPNNLKDLALSIKNKLAL